MVPGGTRFCPGTLLSCRLHPTRCFTWSELLELPCLGLPVYQMGAGVMTTPPSRGALICLLTHLILHNRPGDGRLKADMGAEHSEGCLAQRKAQ